MWILLNNEAINTDNIVRIGKPVCLMFDKNKMESIMSRYEISDVKKFPSRNFEWIYCLIDGEEEFHVLSYYLNMIDQTISTKMFFHNLERIDQNIPNPWQYCVVWKDVSGKLSYVFSKGHTSKEDANMDRMKFLSRLNKTSSLQVINF